MDEDQPEPIRVPHAELSAAALHGLIEAFVLREGTEYGASDVPLATKVAQVRRQLDAREAQIVFDPATEAVLIVLTRDLPSPPDPSTP
jgi:hypothetical protein